MFNMEISYALITLPPPSPCAVPTYYGTSKKGDGLCEGIINNAVCDWDGGDCCPQTTGIIAGKVIIEKSRCGRFL